MWLRLLLLIGLYLFASTTTEGQITTYQLSLIDSTENILYVGIDNKVAIKNVPVNTKVKFEGKDIKPTGSYYMLTPTQAGKSTLRIYDRNNKTIFSKEYPVNYIEDFKLQVGNGKSGLVSLSDIMANPALVINYSSKLKSSWRIVNYDISLMINKVYHEGKSVSGENLSNVPFDKDLRDKIATMKNGDAIFIEGIKAYGPDDRIRLLNALVLDIAFDTTNTEKKYPCTADYRTELRVVLDRMVKGNFLNTDKEVGLLEKLEEVASDSELVQLTDNENAFVENYAFYALASRKNVDQFPILMKHFNDTARVEGQSGLRPTSEYFLSGMMPYSRYSYRNKLTERQVATIDSILLFDTTTHFIGKDYILRYMKPDVRYYGQIRSLTITGAQPVSVLILAKYKDRNDITLIKEALRKNSYYAVLAAREFPDPAFYPSLRKVFKKEWKQLMPYNYYDRQWAVLFEALAQYPSRSTVRLFNKVIELDDDSQNQTLQHYLLIALLKYPNTVFKELDARIKLDASHQVRQKDIDTETW